ncbi:S1 family peptidase [Streptomyces hainanensis]|uniref:S1 family peptidase n=1 Tax=Streptomyces hainanensis TaxID=402648 RepID=A0A4R4TKV3_9ACTN|nr:S1 family peptidase [Streptomyces hainanensis]TDC76384.1 S1 family peptidase [Streptomyces hainanensis]
MSTARTTTAFRRLVTTLAASLLAALGVALPARAEPAPTAFTAHQLAAASDAVLAADIAGTAWAVDPDAGTVRVTVDDTVSPADLARLRGSAGPLADALTFEHTPGTLAPRLRGGEAIYSGSGTRCAVGFNARSGSAYYFVTAGHCTTLASTWYSTPSLGTPVGQTAGTSFPNDDYGLVRYTTPPSPWPPGIVCNGVPVPITGVGSPVIGSSATFSGPVGGCRTGTVTAVNATVNYGGGDIVSGLIRTNICVEPGESGGPLFTPGGLALGILSGGSGNCAVGGTSYFQPIGEVLNAYGLTLP